jgi:hypothetical protein
MGVSQSRQNIKKRSQVFKLSDLMCTGVALEATLRVKPRTSEAIDGYGSKSTNSDLAGFYLLLYIRQHAGLFRR